MELVCSGLRNKQCICDNRSNICLCETNA